MKWLSLTAVLAAAIISNNAFSQSKAGGYYVSMAGDTVKGVFSRYKEWIKNPQKVSFITQQGNEKLALTTGNCRMFAVEGRDMYETHQLQRLMNVPGPSLADDDTASKYDTVTAFMRIAYQNNRLKLLELADGLRLNLYIQPAGGQPEELTYKLIKTVLSFTDDITYRIQLGRYLASEPQYQTAKGQQMLKEVQYTTEGIAKLLEYMSGVKNQLSMSKKIAPRLQVMGGIALNRMDYVVEPSNAVSFENQSRSFNTHTSPVAGIGITLFQQRNFGRNFFHFSLLGYQFRHEARNSLPFSTSVQTTVQQGGVAELLMMGGRNLVHTKRLSWYVAPGLSANFMLNSRQTTEIIFIGGAITNSKTDRHGSFVFSLNAQTGLWLNSRVHIWGRYKFKADIDDFVNYRNQHSSILAGIGYTINRQ
jgi:hypothetical protein